MLSCNYFRHCSASPTEIPSISYQVPISFHICMVFNYLNLILQLLVLLAVTFVVRFASLAWLFLAVYLFFLVVLQEMGKCDGKGKNFWGICVTGSLVHLLGAWDWVLRKAEGGSRMDPGSRIGIQKKKGEIEVREREVRFKKFFGRILRFVAHDELVDGWLFFEGGDVCHRRRLL